MICSQRRILIFAKAPIPGRVKTRLIPDLSPAAATRLHMAMTHKTLALACQSELAPAELWIDHEHPFFERCKRDFSLSLKRQTGADLGLRMHHGLRQTLRHCQYAVIIGTDCPAMEQRHLDTAFKVLEQGRDIVLSPAEDGGYVLIATKRTDNALFNNISWGSDRVMIQTRKVLQRLGWSWAELETLWDVDRPQDLLRLRGKTRFLDLFDDALKSEL
ncbi:MAG: glycosyltransferase [Gammaproteobacteria bacterium]|nr:glycosyltransferase [Gammaproteobacteria bacterium]